MQASATTDGSSGPAVSPTPPAKIAQRIGIPREVFPNEKRVATVPEVVEKLIKLGFKVAVESGAGDLANFSDAAERRRITSGSIRSVK